MGGIAALVKWATLVDFHVIKANEQSFVKWARLVAAYMHNMKEASWAGSFLNYQAVQCARGLPWAAPKAKAKGKGKAKAKGKGKASSSSAGGNL